MRPQSDTFSSTLTHPSPRTWDRFDNNLQPLRSLSHEYNKIVVKACT